MRARWSCLVDADGGRRWVIKGCAAEAAHRAAGGEILGAASSVAATDGILNVHSLQEDTGQGRGADFTYGEKTCEANFIDYGFDNEGFDEVVMQEGECQLGAFDLPPSLPAELPLEEDDGQELGAWPQPPCTPAEPVHDATAQTEAAAGVRAHADGNASMGEAAASSSAWATSGPSGAKRWRLTGKTSPARAAELGHDGFHSEGPVDEEELVTQATAAAARARNRGILLAHRRKVRAVRDQAWETLARQPERSVMGNLGADTAGTEMEVQPGALAPSIPRCWAAHGSHDLAAPAHNLLYCRRCGAWSGGLRTRGLALVCRGPVGQRNNLRLLSLGIAPVKGARVPTEFKAAGSRGTRGGSATASRRRRRQSA